MAGYIKLHRKTLISSVFRSEKALKVFIWCLLKATHKERDELVGLQTVHLEPGQFVYGRIKAAKELEMPQSTVNDIITSLKCQQLIRVKSNNKYSVVTIINWALYQGMDAESDSDSDSKTDSRATAKRHKQECEEYISKINLPESPKTGSVFRENPEAEAWKRYYEELNQYHDKKRHGEKPPYPVKPGETFEEAQRNRYGGSYEQSEGAEAEIGTGKNP